MEWIRVTPENIDREHICCAISNEKDCQVVSKKAWLSQRFADGLVFLKANVRGKCFIEYLPAQKAWCPIQADGWMYIDCLWVSGQWKGKGLSRELLEACIRDSREKGMRGLVILSSQKKRAFLADPKYLRYHGFELADTCAPDYELMCLPFDGAADRPTFRPCVHQPPAERDGFVLYYSDQCPFTAKYAPLPGRMAKERNAPFCEVHLQSAEQAQNAPTPSTSYTLFYHGEWVTNEILSEQKLAKLFEQKGY